MHAQARHARSRHHINETRTGGTKEKKRASELRAFTRPEREKQEKGVQSAAWRWCTTTHTPTSNAGLRNTHSQHPLHNKNRRHHHRHDRFSLAPEGTVLHTSTHSNTTREKGRSENQLPCARATNCMIEKAHKHTHTRTHAYTRTDTQQEGRGQQSGGCAPRAQTCVCVCVCVLGGCVCMHGDRAGPSSEVHVGESAQEREKAAAWRTPPATRGAAQRLPPPPPRKRLRARRTTQDSKTQKTNSQKAVRGQQHVTRCTKAKKGRVEETPASHRPPPVRRREKSAGGQ